MGWGTPCSMKYLKTCGFETLSGDFTQLGVERLDEERMSGWGFEALLGALEHGWSMTSNFILKKGCHPNPIDELHHFSGWDPEASTDDSAVARSTVNGAWRRLRSSWLHACRARKVARRLAAVGKMMEKLVVPEVKCLLLCPLAM